MKLWVSWWHFDAHILYILFMFAWITFSEPKFIWKKEWLHIMQILLGFPTVLAGFPIVLVTVLQVWCNTITKATYKRKHLIGILHFQRVVNSHHTGIISIIKSKCGPWSCVLSYNEMYYKWIKHKVEGKTMKHISLDTKLLLSEGFWFLQKDQNNWKTRVTISYVFRFCFHGIYCSQLI